ncbi:LysE/ArgO family amino acid transporter [Microbacterium sp. NPDC078428]|uniref:LysE/ArgO family amino acid transporter n=1 Tax=Microbacterium sp. NPDC078428 TaxID=3364190 RepID=UPI0037CB178F
MITSALAGLGLGLSLIIAIGAQNLFVLRQGLRRQHTLAVALVCMSSDSALIIAGVAGIGLVLAQLPWLITAVRWAGALFLVGYGILAARRAWRGEDAGVAEVERSYRPAAQAGAPAATTRTAPQTRRAAILSCVALTWLNPHVYLDTVFLLGSIANTHGDDRWWFAVGAVAGSVLWFTALAYGARLLAPLLRSPAAWRALDAVIAVVMVALGVSLVWPA